MCAYLQFFRKLFISILCNYSKLNVNYCNVNVNYCNFLNFENHHIHEKGYTFKNVLSNDNMKQILKMILVDCLHHDSSPIFDNIFRSLKLPFKSFQCINNESVIFLLQFIFKYQVSST